MERIERADGRLRKARKDEIEDSLLRYLVWFICAQLPAAMCFDRLPPEVQDQLTTYRKGMKR